VVLVYHMSRFARNQIEARRYKQLLRERLGIRVVSVTQPMGDDHTDPSSFLAESINEMLTSITPSRCRSGYVVDSSRRHGRDISSVRSPGAIYAILLPSSRFPTPSAPRLSLRCSPATQPAASQTGQSPRG
jgi:hypothetical protein